MILYLLFSHAFGRVRRILTKFVALRPRCDTIVKVEFWVNSLLHLYRQRALVHGRFNNAGLVCDKSRATSRRRRRWRMTSIN